MTVTTLNHLIVGQPLMLECDMSTPRGIDNTVDIVWTRDGIVVERIDDVNSNSSSPEWIFYTNNIYTIPLLGTSDDDVVYECEVIIYASPLVRIRASTILNVTGMWVLNFYLRTFKYQFLILYSTYSCCHSVTICSYKRSYGG